MWIVIKFDKKNFNNLKRDFREKLGEGLRFYFPRFLVQKYKKNKLINKECSLLGDYLFCYHKNFNNPTVLNNIKFSRGLKYFLKNFIKSQNEISNFIDECKSMENKNGYLSQNFLSIEKDRKYRFISGPFTNTIFKIINLQKEKINILLGNVKTVINKKDYLFETA
tara:strand:- start:1044 stop:1541 length:498 start_codon:yes stop_codon:yes gene_type:complete